MGQLDKDQLAAGSVQLWSPHRAISGAKAPSFCMYTHSQACTPTQAKTTVGLFTNLPDDHLKLSPFFMSE